MFVYREPEIVRKARTKKKVSRTYMRVSALTNTMARGVQVNLVKGIKTFRNKIPDRTLLEAWRTGNYAKIMHVIPWPKLYDDIQPAIDKLGETSVSARSFSIPSLPAPSKNELRYDTRNPYIENYLKTRTANLVVDISRNTQEIIQNAVTRSYDKALRPSEVASMIKDSIGLHPRLENAVYNYQQKLLQDGQSQDRVDSLVDKYRDRLLDYRAMTIARTETRNSANQGQLSIWQEAANNGLIERSTAKKVWIVDGNPCEICEPMDGIAVPLDAVWVLSNGIAAMVPSDSHPNCMCGMEISYDNQQPEEE